MKSMREQLTGKCKHIGGSLHKASSDPTEACLAGVSYYELMKIDELGVLGCCCRVPCGGKTGDSIHTCDKYQPLSEQEIQAEIDAWEETTRCLQEGISNCCKAPIDESRAIKEGPHKGHGPRYCSKCRKLAYIV